VLDITSALNISTGTFYLYFRNKQDLFIEVIDDVFKQIVGEAATAIKGEKDFVKRLIIRGRVFYKKYTQYSEVLNQLRAEMAGENQWPAQKIQKIYHGLTKPLIREINDAVNNGVIKKIDADLLAYSLTGTIEMMSLRLSLDSKYDLDDVIGFIVGLMIKPLCSADNEK
jgi:AcrR family transcriptional regulator